MRASEAAVCIVGGGAMGGAIARGLVASGTCPASHVTVCDHNDAKLEALASDCAVSTARDAARALAASPDVVVVAVKPQVLSSLLEEVGPAVAGSLAVSIAAGTPLGSIEEQLGEGARVVRVMPNLPVAVRRGASAVARGLWATDDDVALVCELFGALGSVAVMREDQLDAEGAVIGCAPAYFALMVDALTRAGVDAGLPAAAARDLACATMGGVSEMLSDSGEHPRAYMEKVTSPGGTTAAALRVLEPALVEGCYGAVDAALERTRALSRKG
ncbi:pyrroline-5-carboxylate reductase [Granulimonas faecalis]|uniref:Pyrroline-5-carboxylate reductase n=1 Tax=Granulimonas faecalis TaxID=2894155 RepID=A0AAV5B311_9ACTN|nr:pyrroline-5-carboxylate reductase [Granulimonas faecalis]GJM55487.1 pyrroline-5-carboxylate reductase [Granulimonas faecalis]